MRMTSAGWKRSFGRRSSAGRRGLPRADPQGSASCETRRRHSRHAARHDATAAARPETTRRRVARLTPWNSVAGADEAPASEQPSSVPASGGERRTREARRRSFCAVETTSSRYWTIAAVSALVALVVAGVTAGTGSAPARRMSPPRDDTGRSRPAWWAHTPRVRRRRARRLRVARLTGRGRFRRPFSGAARGRRAWFRQRARRARHSEWAGDRTASGRRPLRRRVGVHRGLGGAAGRCRRLGGTNPAAPVAAAVGSTVSSVGVVGHDASRARSRVPSRPRPDHRRREQCRQCGRSGGERDDL